jgi:hypothetical protein
LLISGLLYALFLSFEPSQEAIYILLLFSSQIGLLLYGYGRSRVF